MKRILFIATESAPGMIPYTSSVINALSKSNEFEIYAVVVNSGKRSYRNYLKGVEHIEYIEYPRSKLLKLIYKQETSVCFFIFYANALKSGCTIRFMT